MEKAHERGEETCYVVVSLSSSASACAEFSVISEAGRARIIPVSGASPAAYHAAAAFLETPNTQCKPGLERYVQSAETPTCYLDL